MEKLTINRGRREDPSCGRGGGIVASWVENPKKFDLGQKI